MESPVDLSSKLSLKPLSHPGRGLISLIQVLVHHACAQKPFLSTPLQIPHPQEKPATSSRQIIAQSPGHDQARRPWSLVLAVECPSGEKRHHHRQHGHIQGALPSDTMAGSDGRRILFRPNHGPRTGIQAQITFHPWFCPCRQLHHSSRVQYLR